MKKLGYNIKKFYYIPFIGAAVEAKEIIVKKNHNLIIYFAGPILGLLFSIFSLLIYKTTGLQFLKDVYTFGIILNLSNLIPVGPLDGGRIIKFLLIGKNFSKKTFFIYLASNLFGIYLIYYFFGFGFFFFLMLYPTFNEVRILYQTVVFIEDETERIKFEQKLETEKDEGVKNKLLKTRWAINYHWYLIDNN